MSDIAPKLVELSADKLRSLHEKLHKSEMTPALLEVHHMTTGEMARRGMEVSKDEPWHDARIQIDYMQDVDLTSFGSSLPEDAVEDVIKTTGSSIGNVRIVLTSFGYAIEIDPVAEDVEKFNENHDPANGQFATGSGGAGGNVSAPEHGKHAWANQLGDALNAGSGPSIDAKDVGKFLNTMANRGDNPDITNLKVNGHTLFGGDGLGIKRINMPQIPIEMRKTFIKDMAKQGIETSIDKVNAMDLKPSQMEISATKTARLYQHFKADGIPKDKAILISKDGYVVDGHHHWAAAAAMGLMGKDGKIPVIRMSVNAKEALSAAKAWSDSHGIAPEGMNTPGLADLNKSEDEIDSWDFEKFNSNHDDRGRFATSSYGAAVNSRRQEIMSGKKLPEIPRDAQGRVINPDATGGYLAGIPESITLGGTTYTPLDSVWHHLVPDGNGGYEFSPERSYLHTQIVNQAISGVPVSTNPTFTMLGGGPASGKTTVVKSGIVQGIPDSKQAVHVNADDVKAKLPENGRMSQSSNDANFFNSAAFVHEESSQLAKRIQSRAIQNRQDVVLDGTGDSDINKLAKKVDEARVAGYKVNGLYVTVPTGIAVSRANKRALGKEKRYVPETVVRGTHADVSRTFPKAVAGGLFDNLTLADNSTGTVKIIGQGTRKNFKIQDQALYDAFIAKGEVK